MPQKKFLSLAIMIMISISQAYATHQCPEGSLNSSCWDCSRTGSDCTAHLQNGVLTISGTGEMRDYSDYYGSNRQNANPWVDRDDIREVIVEEGITLLGGNAFEYGKMSKISLPSSLTHIYFEAFQRADNLEYLVIPDNVTYIGSYNNLHTATNLKGIVIGAAVNEILTSFTLPSSTIIYCNESERRTKTCQELIAEHNSAYTDRIRSFTQTEDGLIKAGNKTYASFSDLAAGTYIPKRIYTIDEANKAAGKINTIKLRYK